MEDHLSANEYNRTQNNRTLRDLTNASGPSSSQPQNPRDSNEPRILRPEFSQRQQKGQRELQLPLCSIEVDSTMNSEDMYHRITSQLQLVTEDSGDSLRHGGQVIGEDSNDANCGLFNSKACHRRIERILKICGITIAVPFIAGKINNNLL